MNLQDRAKVALEAGNRAATSLGEQLTMMLKSIISYLYVVRTVIEYYYQAVLGLGLGLGVCIIGYLTEQKLIGYALIALAVVLLPSMAYAIVLKRRNSRRRQLPSPSAPTTRHPTKSPQYHPSQNQHQPKR